MGLFRSVGNSFKDGWNKNDRNRKAAQDAADKINSIRINGPQHFGIMLDLYKDDETGEVKSLYNLNQVYADHINYVSTTNQKANKAEDNDRHELLRLSNYNSPVDKETNTSKFENNFKPPTEAILSIAKNYKFIYQHAAEILIDYGLPEKDKDGNDQGHGKVEDMDSKWLQAEVLELPVVPSMFNPFYGIHVVGITGNTPLMNNGEEHQINVKGDNENGNQITANYNKNITEDLSDCSIKKLVELSNKQKLGRGTYKYADFMYCKNLGKYSNNRLITLRKFPIPVGDNIWDLAKVDGKDTTWGAVSLPIDVGRLVTWMDDVNKLENILKYNYKEGWEKKEGQMQEVSSQEDSSDRGLIGSIVNLANPTYRHMVGTGFAGGGNSILGMFEGSSDNRFFRAKSTNQDHTILTMYDKNRVYEPTGTVRDTHLYTGKLEFTQNFELVFDYELRAYENINPRTALLDLLNNIQQVTYRAGKFWGGQVWFAGAPGNREGWANANAFIDGAFEKVSDTFSMLLRGDMNFGDFLGNMANKIGEGINNLASKAGEIAQNPSKLGNSIADAAQRYDVGGMLKGMLKNRLGRPALYATNSILSGDPVGLWHLTIGNPRNPIMAIGNLIIEDSTIQHYGPLGIDDFPIGLKVTVQLKHAKSRDMVDIGKMYTMGRMGIGVPLSRTAISDMYESAFHAPELSKTMFSTAFAATSPAISDGVTDKISDKSDF